MSTSRFQNMCELLNEDDCVKKSNEMSPVTNLTLNLKSLTTSLTGTPTRRLSWSNPFPCDGGTKKFLDNFSPSIDSPTFQETAIRFNRFKLRKASRMVLPSDSDDEKENVVPEMISIPHIKRISASDSQDSGYSDTSLKNFEMSSPSSTPRIQVKSSIFAEDSEDGFSVFQMGEDEDQKEFLPIPDMTSLLTKPLYNNVDSSTPDFTTKTGKFPIRRCLSMEMECSFNPSPCKLELISQTGTFVASSVVESDINTVHEPSKKCPFKRPDPPSECFPSQNKRRKSSPSVNLSTDISEKMDFTFQRSFSETAATIMHAVQIADLQPDLIGDCSKCYSLPLIKGRHQDLKCISPQTLVQLLRGEFKHEIDSYILVDCRYPYEFEGGHIQGALNIYTQEDILETFLKGAPFSTQRKIIIFHCEFSSERAPKLCRFLRNKDREINESSYPKLHHPEVYLLDGGYKAFFQDFKELCEPQDYKPMNHKDHGFELKQFRAKSKSWGSDSKSRYKLKSSSMSEKL